MEEGIPRKPYAVSEEFDKNLTRVYEYGIETFGYFQAERYNDKIRRSRDSDLLTCRGAKNRAIRIYLIRNF
jgi:hypothetical protein